MKNTTQNLLELDYSGDLTKRLVTVDKTERYLGHPDLVQTCSGRLLCVYPFGHGRGEILMKYSDDFGATWSERVSGLPKSWLNSKETPTVYRLEFNDGSSKLVLVSGAPPWNSVVRDGVRLPKEAPAGFNFSFSNDDGNSWSEFENFYSPLGAIVAMSSLTKMKENGLFVDKWMGTFHDKNFVNYKTFLTFERGKAYWSKPEPLLEEHRKVEKKACLCESEILRSPSDELILLGRAEKRRTHSLISLSRDEGKTWTEPKELPFVLCGDRHKAEYDEKSGKVIVSFRQILPVKYGLFGLKREVASDGWVCWIGTFEDLISMATKEDNTRFGEKLYLLGKDFACGGDCGYSGVVVGAGKAVLVTYGTFDENSKNPYIVSLSLELDQSSNSTVTD